MMYIIYFFFVSSVNKLDGSGDTLICLSKQVGPVLKWPQIGNDCNQSLNTMLKLYTIHIIQLI